MNIQTTFLSGFGCGFGITLLMWAFVHGYLAIKRSIDLTAETD